MTATTGDSPSSLLLVTLSGVVYGIAAALVAGVIEGGMAWGAGGGFSGILLAIALLAPLGAMLGFASGLITGGIKRALGGRFLAPLRDAPALDNNTAGALLTAAAVSGAVIVAVYVFAAGPASKMANQQLAYLSTALVAGIAVLAATIFGIGLFYPLRSVAKVVPRGRLPRTATLLGLFAIGGAGLGVLVLSRVDWRVIKFGPFVTLGLLGCLTFIICWLRTKTLPLLIAIITIAIAAGFGGSASSLGGDPKTVAATLEASPLSGRLITVLRALSDKDGDGFSAAFAGGDCDDTNKQINPGARDIPGNGIDENCAGGDAKPPAPKIRRKKPVASAKHKQFKGNLLIICIDTLRADALGKETAPGHPRTPSMDLLAQNGTRFRRAYAQGPNTPQSVPSVFTSLYPSRVKFRGKSSFPPLHDDNLTVFEVLKDAGYDVYGTSSHFYFAARRNMAQGFVRWDNEGATSLRDSNKDIAAPRIVAKTDKLLAKLKDNKKPWVLFVHLFEPHSTYVKHRSSGYKYTKRGSAGLREKYDYEVQYVDGWVGKLLESLKRHGLAQKTAVTLFSDHGEAFGEHKFYFHGQALYEEVLRVPLIISVPGLKHQAPTVPVALIDLAPTWLDILGITIPDGFRGESLLPLLQGDKIKGLEDRAIGAVLMPYKAWPKGQQVMIKNDRKVLYRTTENRLEVYDLAKDPGERNNLAKGNPGLAKQAKAALNTFVEQEL